MAACCPYLPQAGTLLLISGEHACLSPSLYMWREGREEGEEEGKLYPIASSGHARGQWQVTVGQLQFVGSNLPTCPAKLLLHSHDFLPPPPALLRARHACA